MRAIQWLSFAAVSCAALSFSAPAAAQIGLQLTAGIDGGIDVPADPLLVPPTGITVEAWVTYDDATVPTGLFYWPTIARQNITPQMEVYNFRVSASNNGSRTLQWTVRIGTALQNVTYTFAPGEFATFTHLAATYDGQILRIVKNGVQVATRTLPSANELVNSGGVLRIGNGDPVIAGRESWNGILDEVRIWPMARTDAEIQATMNQALGSWPGKVLVFPLDGHAIDVSNGLVGNLFGTHAFAPGAPALQVIGYAMTPVGQSTSLCPRSIDATLGSLPSIGNAAFAIWATRGPRPAVSPLGLLIGATLPAPPGLPLALGLQLAFDPGTVVWQTTLIPPTGVLGNARWPIPLPPDPTFPGVSLVFQFGFADATCGPQGITASNGIQFTLQ